MHSVCILKAHYYFIHPYSGWRMNERKLYTFRPQNDWLARAILEAELIKTRHYGRVEIQNKEDDR